MFQDAAPRKSADLAFPIHRSLSDRNTLNERTLFRIFHMYICDVPLHSLITIGIWHLRRSIAVARIPVSPERWRVHGSDQFGRVRSRVAPEAGFILNCKGNSMFLRP